MKRIGRGCVLAGLLAAVCPAPLAAAALKDAPVELQLQPGSADALRRDATVNAIERVMPGVVNIATSRIVEYRDFYDELRREFFGQPPSQPQTQEQLDSLGSGVIIDEDGYILTNWHVVRRATRIQVKLSDGRVFDAERVVATEKSDVALLKLRANPGEKFTAVRFAGDDDLLLGETVLALGNPFGLGGSVSRGILSSKNRRPATGAEPLNIADWLQTDAAINPGNSGGPLVNLNGELIGISVAVYRQAQGIGFAIPIRQVSSALAQFFSPEVTCSMWFGAHLKGGHSPLVIADVQPGSPAAKAGLKPGTQIAQVNGKSPGSIVQFSELMMTSPESREVSLLIVEDGRRQSVKVALQPFEEIIKARLGLALEELTPREATRLGLRDVQGLMIKAVEKDSPAARAKIEPGMLLVGFDSTSLDELRDLGLKLVQKNRDDPAVLTVILFKRLSQGYVQAVQAKAEVKLR